MLTRPIFSVTLFISNLILKKTKVNGRNVYLFGALIKFPRNIGIGINTKIFWEGDKGYEYYTSRTLVHFFREVDLFIDVGSNFGLYSVLAHKINPKIKSICFEPLPNMYQDNLNFHKVNGIENVTHFNLALSSREGTTTFYVPNVYNVDSEITSASIEPNFAYNKPFASKEITINTVMFDRLYAEKSIEFEHKRIVVKVDVEGHEFEALQGAKQFIFDNQPILIVEIESNDKNKIKIWEYFNTSSYSVFVITSSGYFKLQSLEEFIDFGYSRDYLFLPTKHYKKHYYPLVSFSAANR